MPHFHQEYFLQLRIKKLELTLGRNFKRNGQAVCLMGQFRRHPGGRNQGKTMQELTVYLAKTEQIMETNQILLILLGKSQRLNNGHQLERRRLLSRGRMKNYMEEVLQPMAQGKRVMVLLWLMVQTGETCNKNILILL